MEHRRARYSSSFSTDSMELFSLQSGILAHLYNRLLLFAPFRQTGRDGRDIFSESEQCCVFIFKFYLQVSSEEI